MLNAFYSSIRINFKKYFPDEANYEVATSPPFDSISLIRYSPTNPHQLLVSAWDAVGPVCSVLVMKNLLFLFQTVRLYETDDIEGHKTEAKAKFNHSAAVLGCSLQMAHTPLVVGKIPTPIPNGCKRTTISDSIQMTAVIVWAPTSRYVSFFAHFLLQVLSTNYHLGSNLLLMKGVSAKRTSPTNALATLLITTSFKRDVLFATGGLRSERGVKRLVEDR